jgi:DNA modification methylase
MKNRFNRLTSKEWLPFQKSWFRYSTDLQLLWENIRFFTHAQPSDSVVLYQGENFSTARKICKEHNLDLKRWEDHQGEPVQFAIMDLRPVITADTTMEAYEAIRQEVVKKVEALYEYIEYKRFISIIIPNIQQGPTYLPYAWDLAKHLSSILSLKDEKIACVSGDKVPAGQQGVFQPGQEVFYCLYFKKDDHAGGTYQAPANRFFENNVQQANGIPFSEPIPSWFILKPQPRKKNEILHPAKYPEDLVELFVSRFTLPGQRVFDPMSGTGSTQLASLKLDRNAYGTELSAFFAEIAQSRCREFLQPLQKEMFSGENNLAECGILQKDARSIESSDFPPMDYLLTSPPYWDMLNMKGAENQAKRLKLGLQTNYSDSDKDLGNINDYQEFLKELTGIYFRVFDVLKSGAYVTIVVKNIKKKGRNYPFAWDLANALQQKLILLPEVFWCQDDISIAPYGYGNTWVSNTFHQYCLNFQVPGNAIDMPPRRGG